MSHKSKKVTAIDILKFWDEIVENFGDVDIYIDDGTDGAKLLTAVDIKISSACALFNTDDLDIDDSDIVAYISKQDAQKSNKVMRWRINTD
jgi:hypothetical protein